MNAKTEESIREGVRRFRVAGSNENVEAMELDGGWETADAALDWIRENRKGKVSFATPSVSVCMDGETASENDWIVKDSEGEFHIVDKTAIALDFVVDDETPINQGDER